MYNSHIVMKKFVSIALLALSCGIAYAHAGMYDRWWGRFVSLVAIQTMICVTQIACFILIRNDKYKHYRMRLLFVAKNLQKKWRINMIATWGLSSFVLSSYWTVVGESAFMLGMLLLFVLWVWYSYLVLRRNKRWIFGIKPFYLYVVASFGQIIGIVLYEMLSLMGVGISIVDYLAYDMGHVIIAMAIPYMLLMIYLFFARLAGE